MRVACVALEQEEARIAQLERPVAGADDRHRCRVERELLDLASVYISIEAVLPPASNTLSSVNRVAV